jgi:hypothetical protein
MIREMFRVLELTELEHPNTVSPAQQAELVDLEARS